MIRLFRVFVPSSVLALLVFDILLITSAFILTTYLVMEVDPVPYLLYDRGLVRIFVMVLTILIGLYLQDFYPRFHVQSRIVLLQDLCVAMGWAFLLQGLISYLDPDLKSPMPVILWGSLLTLVSPGFAVSRLPHTDRSFSLVLVVVLNVRLRLKL